MSGAERGDCDICGKVGVPVAREYYEYDIDCDCGCMNKYGPHFEIVWYCADCKPVPPKDVVPYCCHINQKQPCLARIKPIMKDKALGDLGGPSALGNPGNPGIVTSGYSHIDGGSVGSGSVTTTVQNGELVRVTEVQPFTPHDAKRLILEENRKKGIARDQKYSSYLDAAVQNIKSAISKNVELKDNFEKVAVLVRANIEMDEEAQNVANFVSSKLDSYGWVVLITEDPEFIRIIVDLPKSFENIRESGIIPG
jgi:hypothetical protein